MNLSFHTALHISTITFFHFGALPCCPWPVHLPPKLINSLTNWTPLQTVIEQLSHVYSNISLQSLICQSPRFTTLQAPICGFWFRFIRSNQTVSLIVTLPIMDWSTLTRPCSNPSDWGSQLGFVVAAILKRTLTENRGRSKMSNNVAINIFKKLNVSCLFPKTTNAHNEKP